MSEFSARLRRLRLTARPVRSMAAVSELCGLEKSAVRRYERGERLPNMEALMALADYYEVSLDWLTGRTGRRGGDDLGGRSCWRRPGP